VGLSLAYSGVAIRVHPQRGVTPPFFVDTTTGAAYTVNVAEMMFAKQKMLDKISFIRYNKDVAGFAPHIELLRIRPPGWEIPAIWELRFGFNHGGELPRHFYCGG